jgi:hypothetical protein
MDGVSVPGPAVSGYDGAGFACSHAIDQNSSSITCWGSPWPGSLSLYLSLSSSEMGHMVCLQGNGKESPEECTVSICPLRSLQTQSLKDQCPWSTG